MKLTLDEVLVLRKARSDLSPREHWTSNPSSEAGRFGTTGTTYTAVYAKAMSKRSKI